MSEKATAAAWDNLRASLAPAREAEERAVRDLGDRIGYGNMMHLAERAWREKLASSGYPSGGEFSVGPCAALLVPCPCPTSGHCEWCCGSKRVTKRVADAIGALAEEDV